MQKKYNCTLVMPDNSMYTVRGGETMVSQARIKANAKYDAKNTKQFRLKLNLNTDADIIKKLGDVENMQGYIKALIRKDIAETEA